jgi:peptide deformylase
MAVLKVRRYGDPVLRRRAVAIDAVTPEIRRLADDMIDTMYDEVGIGLAARRSASPCACWWSAMKKGAAPRCS